jgi:hypothetical protein
MPYRSACTFSSFLNFGTSSRCIVTFTSLLLYPLGKVYVNICKLLQKLLFFNTQIKYRVGQTQLGSFWSLITNQSNNTRENGKVPIVVDRWQLYYLLPHIIIFSHSVYYVLLLRILYSVLLMYDCLRIVNCLFNTSTGHKPSCSWY